MQVGAVIAERYRLERIAGSGGMGTVYCARDLERDRAVAVKLGHAGASSENNRRTVREARILAERLTVMRHPHIVDYVDHGIAPSGVPFLVMEWLEGCSLSARLKRAPLGEGETIALALRLARALAAVHGCGVVHRDLKPGNVFLPGDDLARVKLIDFGLVRVDAEQSQLTRSGILLGTPGFMAPEQVDEAGAVDARADLYALGAVMFACLTQRPPFAGTHFMAILGRLAFEEAPRVSELGAAVSPALDELIARLLSKDPDERPATADALAELLAPLLAEAGQRRAGGALGGHARLPATAVSRGEQAFLTALLAGPLQLQSPGGARSAALVSSHGAEVMELADATLLAVFAAATAPEDTAVRAARCAMALRHDHPGVSVALATGRGTTHGRRPVGEVIERVVALHFEPAAPRAGLLASEDATLVSARSGGVLIDDVTAGLLGNRFTLELEDAPGRSYRLLAERAAAPDPASESFDGACIGRERELGVLSALLEECVELSEPRRILLLGAAGAGKSRLAHAFLDSLDEIPTESDTAVEGGPGGAGMAPRVWRVAGDPVRASSSLGFLGQLVSCAADLGEVAGSDERRAALASYLRQLVPAAEAPRVIAFLSEIAGLPLPAGADLQLREARQDARLMHDQMLRACEDWLDAVAATAPLVLVLDDLQWCDLPSARFLDTALRNLGDRAIFALLLGRPETEALLAEVWGLPQFDRLPLRPLSRQACRALAAQWAPGALSEKQLARLVERADGNPFYLEELLRSARAGQGGELPGTVLALVGMRLAALPAEERRVLRAGSVFGSHFWPSGVAALLGPDTSSAEVRALLEHLVRRDLVRPERRVSLAGEAGYRFRHELVREAAYAMLPDEDCVRAHRRAGTWLEEAGERDAAVLAEHYRRGRDAGRARPWFRRAAEQALEADDVQAALVHVARAVDYGADGEELGALRLLEAEALNWTADHRGARRAAAEAMEHLPRGGDAWALAAHQRSWAAIYDGDNATVLEVAAALLERAGAQPSEAFQVALARCATHLGALNEYQQAAACEQRLRALDSPPTPSVSGTIHHMRALLAGLAGRADKAARWFLAAIEQWELAGNMRQAALDGNNLGVTLRELGQYERAEAASRAAFELGQRLAIEHLVEASRDDLAMALVRQDRLEEARALLARGDIARQPFRGVYRAQLEIRAGHPARALEHLEQAMRWYQHEVSSDAPAVTQAVRARALLALGRVDEAVRASRAGMAYVLAGGTLQEGEALLRLVFAESLLATGEREHARLAIAEAWARIEYKAGQIDDPMWRQSFLQAVDEHRRTADLARYLGANAGDEPGGA
ncbi:serine/threonine protein kinase [Haliangium ochraceum DSM 14365]|uniref:Serine/threonine protein kinase n=2 Tax=Haliangium ochraceum TaxID=80816 RepID=D0LJI2_HALO1|nr:protein kinase [Haliangium ochraceum]ACY16556.1 serine/threonine protein kinase [Haliangium ochraceum DSM 14365]